MWVSKHQLSSKCLECAFLTSVEGLGLTHYFDEMAKTVNDSIQEYFPNDTSLTLTAEPGRFFVETAVTMVTNAIGKRVRGNEIQYLIDDGI